MKIDKINDRKEYNELMQRIEKILQKTTKNKGFDNLTVKVKEELKQLSLIAENYENNIKLMPIKSDKI